MKNVRLYASLLSLCAFGMACGAASSDASNEVDASGTPSTSGNARSSHGSSSAGTDGATPTAGAAPSSIDGADGAIGSPGERESGSSQNVEAADAGREGAAAADASTGGDTRDTGPSTAPDGDAAVAANDGDAAMAQGPSAFHCVNWADERDNFVEGLLQVSGLDSATDSYATVLAKADAILSGFQNELAANAIRIPINEPTVSGSWWTAYKGIIDAAIAKGMKVIIAYWAYENGKPDSVPAYYAMWQTVVDAYATEPLAYFDIHNEPYGFSSSDWLTFAETWVSTFSTVPRDHIIIAGTGYDQNDVPVGADPQLDGTLLSLHIYTFFSPSITTVQGWEEDLQSCVGSYYPRTVATEWGAPMSTGTDYDVSAAAADGGLYTSYMDGVPDQLRAFGMGSCYWPGLRIGDAWSITTPHGTGTDLSLSVTNDSGLDRIHWAWGL